MEKEIHDKSDNFGLSGQPFHCRIRDRNTAETTVQRPSGSGEKIWRSALPVLALLNRTFSALLRHR
jgi:hypothetical protein